MRVREFQPSDWPRIVELFAQQGFEYELPEPEAFEAIDVLVDDDDRVVMALAARPTVEMFMLADKNWSTPAWRFQGFKLVHESIRQRLAGLGYSDVHAWLPPEIAKSFGRRLEKQFGWVKSTWPNFMRWIR